MSVATEIIAVREQLNDLASRIEAVEVRLDRGGTTPSPTFDFVSVLANIRDITQELFPGTCKFTSEFDPGYPEDRYVVVNVEATGSPKELVGLSCQWDERIRQMSRELAENLRLSIVPR